MRARHWTVLQRRRASRQSAAGGAQTGAAPRRSAEAVARDDDGVPNVGKSTLVNTLLNRRIANVGDEPAVTKLIKRYDLTDGTWLFDTPGLMWPKIALETDGLLLAATIWSASTPTSTKRSLPISPAFCWLAIRQR